MDKNTYKYKAVDVKTGKSIEMFRTIQSIDSWIQLQIDKRGLDGRAGYFVQFRDGLNIEIFKLTGEKLKYESKHKYRTY